MKVKTEKREGYSEEKS